MSWRALGFEREASSTDMRWVPVAAGTKAIGCFLWRPLPKGRLCWSGMSSKPSSLGSGFCGGFILFGSMAYSPFRVECL